jgi:SPP1 gp7 family putative phage head morphogenesis protein|tara:strand:- start:17 stop:1213 length:1197 start_codon:yes stop_codon:yes gene_type:complete
MSEPEAFYRQAIDLNRYSNHVALNIMRAYNDIVIDALQKLDDVGSLNPREAARLNALLAQVRESLATWAGDSSVYAVQEFNGLARLQADFITGQIQEVVKPSLAVSVRSVEITPDFARSVVLADPTDISAAVLQPSLEQQVRGQFPGLVSLDAGKGSAMVLPNGKTLSKGFRQLAEASADKFRVTVQNGMLTGENMRDMVKRLRGKLRLADAAGISQTIAKGGELTTLADSQIRALIRTSVTQMVNTVNQQMYIANQDVIDSYRYRAVLDLQTTPICQSLDGKVFKFGKGPQPPQHFGCRSTIVFVTKTEAEGDFREREKRAALGGLVPADMTYPEWIAKQSVAAQEKALGGQKKARLFRNLLKKESPQKALAKFVSSDGSELTLKELMSKYGAPETR